jgi:hypothetical protein
MAKLNPPVVIARYPIQYVIVLVCELLLQRGDTLCGHCRSCMRRVAFSNSNSNLYLFTRPFYLASHCPVSGFENYKHDTRNDSSFDSKDRRSAAPIEEDRHKQIKYSFVKEIIDGSSAQCNGQAGRDISCKAYKEYPQTCVRLVQPPSPEENQDRKCRRHCYVSRSKSLLTRKLASPGICNEDLPSHQKVRPSNEEVEISLPLR